MKSSKLPFEILENIFNFLNNEDLLTLIKSDENIKNFLLLKIFRYKKLDINPKYLTYNIYKEIKNIDKNICNYKMFEERWNIFTFNILKDIDWEDIIVAGGSMNIILNEENKIEDNKNSDIDIFIYGNDLKKKIRKFIYLLHYFDKLKLQIKYIHRDNIIELLIKNYRKIQIIFTFFENPNDIIYSFDLSHVQIFYDGKNIYATHLGFNSLINKKSVSLDTFLLKEREKKAKNRGYKIINNNDDIYLKRSSSYNIYNYNITYETNIKKIVKLLEDDINPIYNKDMSYYVSDKKLCNINISKVIDISNYPLNIKINSNFIKENNKFIFYKDGNISVFQSPLISINKQSGFDFFINDQNFIQWLNLNNILIVNNLINLPFYYTNRFYEYDI